MTTLLEACISRTDNTEASSSRTDNDSCRGGRLAHEADHPNTKSSEEADDEKYNDRQVDSVRISVCVWCQ